MNELIQDTLELTYDIITKPHSSMSRIVSGMRYREGLMIWGFTMLLPCFSAMFQMGRFSASLFIGTIVGACLLLVIQVVFVHGAASLFGGKGPILGLAAGICFSDVPLCFATLAESLVFVLPSSLVHVLTLGVTIWSIYVAVLAVKINYGLDGGRSIVALFLPVILIVGIIALLAVYFVYSIASLVSGF